jgi:hypothetical protein
MLSFSPGALDRLNSFFPVFVVAFEMPYRMLVHMRSVLCSHTCWKQRFDIEALTAWDFVLFDDMPTNVKKHNCEEYLTCFSARPDGSD